MMKQVTLLAVESKAEDVERTLLRINGIDPNLEYTVDKSKEVEGNVYTQLSREEMIDTIIRERFGKDRI